MYTLQGIVRDARSDILLAYGVPKHSVEKNILKLISYPRPYRELRLRMSRERSIFEGSTFYITGLRRTHVKNQYEPVEYLVGSFPRNGSEAIRIFNSMVYQYMSMAKLPEAA